MIFEIIVYTWLVCAVITFFYLSSEWWEEMRYERTVWKAFGVFLLSLIVCVLSWPMLLYMFLVSKYY